jgi:hypothetical protein
MPGAASSAKLTARAPPRVRRLEIERIEVEAVTGKIIIVAKGAEAAESSNPLDDWLAKNARSPRN